MHHPTTPPSQYLSLQLLPTLLHNARAAVAQVASASGPPDGAAAPDVELSVATLNWSHPPEAGTPPAPHPPPPFFPPIALSVATLNWSHPREVPTPPPPHPHPTPLPLPHQDLVLAHGSNWDVVIASDIVYSSGCVEGLVAALGVLLRSGGLLLVSYPSGRFGRNDFFEALAQSGFEGGGGGCDRGGALEEVQMEPVWGSAHQGSAEEVESHQFMLLRARRVEGVTT